MNNDMPRVSKHLAYLNHELDLGGAPLAGVSEEVMRAVLAETFHLSPKFLPYTTDRLMAILELLVKKGAIPAIPDELLPATIQSMLPFFNWDKTLRVLDSQVVQHFKRVGMPREHNFSTLFELPNQMYYLAMRGRAFGSDFDGMWVFRDISPFGELVTVGFELLKVANSQARVISSVAFPEASTWVEATDRALYHEKLILQSGGLGGGRSAWERYMFFADGGIEAWEPLVALAYGALCEPETLNKEPSVEMEGGEIATRYGSLSQEGRVVFSKEAPGMIPRQRLSRHRHALPQGLN